MKLFILANRLATRGDSQRTRRLVWSVPTLMLTAAVLLAGGARGHAQTTTGTLTGIADDNTGARIPGAGVTLTNQSSHDTRSMSTNGEGVFTFSSIPTGTYTVTLRRQGFQTTTVKNIEIHPGDQRSLSDIKMPVGASDVSVTVSADSSVVSNGERSVLITAQDIQHLSTEGRDVTELLKILPGFAQLPGGSTNSTGLSNATPGSNLVVSPGSGLGNYSANGAPASGAGLVSDGANIQDPGDAGTSTQNINMDMVDEVKVQTSNFGADSEKGPIVVNAVGKSGGSDYHGSLYVYARTYQLNSQDWLSNHFGYQKPSDRYLYPGVNVGGPIRIPGTNFNHDKRLTFWAGVEDYAQRNTFSGGSAQGAIRLSTVPTAGMRAGDFSATELGKMFGVSATDEPLECSGTDSNGLSLTAFSNFCAVPSGQQLSGATITNGQIGPFDPGAAAILKIFPLPNRTPQPVAGTNQASDGFNRQDLYLVNADNYQARGRVDYSQSDNTKYFATYNIERGNSYSPFTLYYNPNYNQGIIADPASIEDTINSQTASLNFTHTFSQTLTNEAFAAISFYNNPYFSADEAAQTRAALGYPYGGLFNNGSKQIPQLGYGTALPLYQGPDFSFGSIFARKFSVDFGDNVSKTWGAHLTKVGFYFERESNNQRAPFNPTQGTIAEYGNYAQIPDVNGTSGFIPNPGNAIVSFLYGFANSYGEQNSLPIQDMNFLTMDGYATDSWKLSKRLTLDLGVRFDHLGPWVDTHGNGLAVWEPNLYAGDLNSSGADTSATNPFPGIRWHATQSSLPASGTSSRAIFVEPRVGFAYDFFGDGSTTIRGGWGMYVSHDSWSDYSNALAQGQGSYEVFLNNLTLAQVSAMGSSTSPQVIPGSVNAYAVLPSDDQQPTSYTYSLTIEQRMPGRSVFDLAYTGSESAHLIVATNGSNLQNIDTVPFGGMFQPDPNPFSPFYQQVHPPDYYATQSSYGGSSDFAPYPYYATLDIIRHGLHTNYNGLQTSWVKSTGHSLFNFNYTWSRTFGDRATDNGGGGVGDGTNERNDVGILQYDRQHIFNASYTVMSGTIFHGNRMVGGLVNGWELSGITNVQSGPNIQAATSSNFGLQSYTFNNFNPSAPASTSIDNRTWLGTPNISLQPALSCNPAEGLAKNQFVKGACLTLPAIGTNGPFRYPYMHGPAYFNSDLSAQKSFHLSEKREIIFRYSAFNFLNHPLTSLVGATAQPLQLTLTPTNTATATATNPGAVTANGAFGLAQYKENRRVSELSLRFNF